MSPLEVTVIPTDGFNLKIIDQSISNQPAFSVGSLTLQPSPPVHHWFAGTLANLPVTHPVKICISMQGNDMPGNPANVGKWIGLEPFLTYADPTRYESYEWFERGDDGRWISGDIFKRGRTRYAGSGNIPKQSVLPPELAEECLDASGKFWMPWRRITGGEAAPADNEFTFSCSFARSTATIAMHLPYSYDYQQQFLDRLRMGNFPGVFIDEIGKTPEGRALQVIRLEDPKRITPLRMDTVSKDGNAFLSPWVDESPDKTPRDHRVIVINAREHGTEHTSSWPLLGMLKRLVANDAEGRRLRRKSTWLLIPLHDPDGAVNSQFCEMTSRFYNHYNFATKSDDTPQEVLAYARYMRAFVNSGRPIYITTSFYNLECNEGESVMCPFIHSTEETISRAVIKLWFGHLDSLGIDSRRRDPWLTGLVPFRLSGWMSDVYGSLPLIFEVNDQWPGCRLSRRELELVGASFVAVVHEFLQSRIGRYRAEETRRFLVRRQMQMQTRYHHSPAVIKAGMLPDIISLGY